MEYDSSELITHLIKLSDDNTLTIEKKYFNDFFKHYEKTIKIGSYIKSGNYGSVFTATDLSHKKFAIKFEVKLIGMSVTEESVSTTLKEYMKYHEHYVIVYGYIINKPVTSIQNVSFLLVTIMELGHSDVGSYLSTDTILSFERSVLGTDSSDIIFLKRLQLKSDCITDYFKHLNWLLYEQELDCYDLKVENAIVVSDVKGVRSKLIDIDGSKCVIPDYSNCKSSLKQFIILSNVVDVYGSLFGERRMFQLDTDINFKKMVFFRKSFNNVSVVNDMLNNINETVTSVTKCTIFKGSTYQMIEQIASYLSSFDKFSRSGRVTRYTSRYSHLNYDAIKEFLVYLKDSFDMVDVYTKDPFNYLNPASYVK